MKAESIDTHGTSVIRDRWAWDSGSNRSGRKARSLMRQREHRAVRSKIKRQLQQAEE